MINQGVAFETELVITFAILFLLAVVNGAIAYSYLGIKVRFLSKLFIILDSKLSRRSKNSNNEENKVEFKKEYEKENVIENLLTRIYHHISIVTSVLWKYKWLILNILLFPLVVFFILDMTKSPGRIWHYPGNMENLRSYDEPLVIEFDRPIFSNDIQPYIFPEIDGEWRVETANSWLPWSKRQVKFYPKESMFPGKVFIYYAGITDVFERTERWEYGIDAFSVPVPEITSITPDNETVNFPVDGEIKVEMDIPAGRSIEWELEILPAVEYELEYVDGDHISINLADRLEQSTEYSFKLYRVPVRYTIETNEIIERAEKELVREITFTTVKEPLIESLTPKGSGVWVNSNIKVVFDNEMDKASVEENFALSPEVKGTVSWEDGRTFIFDPDTDLAKETEYAIAFPAGLKSLQGGYTETNVTRRFTTIGAVAVSSFSPGNSASRSANLSITFNQEVDKSSAQSHVSISPALEGTFSWSANTLIFNPTNDLAFDSTYTISVSPGIKTIRGLDSRSAYSHSFTTEPEVFILNVPIYYQVLRYSCNLVSTRMALAHRGIYISTLTAHSQIAKDNTPWNAENNTWGNPNVGYLGDIYGVSKGYGVYWGPISGLISNYRANSVRTGWNRTAALQEVKNGNPVIIWAHNGYSYAGQNISWTTPGGQSIYAVSGMHSYVIVGWEGPMDNPTSIYLNDPNRGRWKVSTGYFNSLWSFFNNSAVVVY